MAIQYKGRTLTRNQQAAQVREWAGWNRDEYKRAYNILRHQVINYENINGLPRGTYNPADILAREQRRQYYERRGIASDPSPIFVAISTAVKTGTGSKKPRGISTKRIAAIRAAREVSIQKGYGRYLPKVNDEGEVIRTETTDRFEQILSDVQSQQLPGVTDPYAEAERRLWNEYRERYAEYQEEKKRNPFKVPPKSPD